MTLARQRWILFFAPLLLALPFLNRAYFVDDHFFVEIAQWIAEHPEQPFDFPTDGQAPNPALSGAERAGRIVNPLLHHYYLAALIKIGGSREAWLRFGCVLLSCFSALLLFELARRWLEHAFWGTLLVLVTPVFWLTSYSLLIDPTMTLLVLLGLETFLRGAERGSLAMSVLSGVCWGLALLTKYTAIVGLALGLAWVLLSWRSLSHRAGLIVSPIVALSFLAALVVVTKISSGESHLVAASQWVLHTPTIGKILSMLVFLSGCFIAPTAAWSWLKPRRLASVVAVFVLVTLFLMSPWGGFAWSVSALMSLWIVSSVMFLVFSFQLAGRQATVTDRFVFAWLALFLAMMLIVMPWMAARYFVVAAPGVIFAVVRLIELRRPQRAASDLKVLIAVTFVVGAALAYADYSQAETARRVVTDVQERAAAPVQPHRLYYFGDDFVMTYLRLAGVATPMGLIPSWQPGDRVIASSVTLPLGWFLRKQIPVRLVDTIDYSSKFPVKVMDSKAGAAFYGSAWGPLPFAFSLNSWERFYVFEIIGPA